jgi:hypothetical protein
MTVQDYLRFRHADLPPLLVAVWRRNGDFCETKWERDAAAPVFWFSVKLRREEAAEGEIPPYGRGFSRHEDLSSDLLFAA